MQNSLTSTIRIISILFFSLCQIQICYPQEYYEEITYPDTINIVSMLPINYDTIFIGGNTEYANGGVYKSFDGGATWEFAGLDGFSVYSMIRGYGDTIYVCANRSVFRTGDLGENWERLLQLERNVVSLASIGSGQIFVGFGGGIMRSLDNGLTWDTSLALNQDSFIHAILPVSENEIYAAGTSYTIIDAGVFVSRDLGETWDYIGLLGNNIQALGYNADHELFAGCYYDGLLKTADSGMTWETVFPHRDVLSIVIDYNEMYVGCGNQSYFNGGIFYSSDNGVTWEDHTYNITNKDVTDIAITDDQYFYSLSRYEAAVLGPPFNRSVDPVFINERNSSKYQNVKIFPNPASDFLNISIPPAYRNNGKLIFSIYDQIGHMIKNDSTSLSPDSQTFSTNITHLTPGIYYLKIIIGQSKYLHKFIVQ